MHMDTPSYNKVINVVIPMAGRGTRFTSAGYTEVPKPLIDVHGAPMIQRVIENLNTYTKGKLQFHFIVYKEHINNFKVDELLYKLLPDCNIVTVAKTPQGPCASSLEAIYYINNDNPLIITNSDQIIEDLNLDKFIETADKHKLEGLVGTFDSDSPKNSYIEMDINEEFGVRIREKEVISKFATNGFHYWKKGSYFVSSSLEMILRNDTVNGEYYVAPSYNYLINKKYKIGKYQFKEHYPIGIPSDLKIYLQKNAI